MEQTYNIRTVLDLTGHNEHTLRAWERRYELVVPQRSETGRRLYSTRDVERLRLVAALTSRGHQVGNLARLSDSDLAELCRGTPARAPQLARRSEDAAALVTDAEAALRCYDFDSAYEVIHRARLTQGTHGFVLDVVAPLMTTIGAMVEARTLSIAQEHAMSAIVKAQLMSLMFELRRSFHDVGQRRIGFATLPGDLHEIGLLISAVLCANSGHAVEYLGPNLPIDALAKALGAMATDVVVLAIAPNVDADTARAQIHSLAAALPKHHAIWIGGAVGAFEGLDCERPLHAFASLETFAAHLREER